MQNVALGIVGEGFYPVFELHQVPLIVPDIAGSLGVFILGLSRSTSRLRSSPASASLICVPMLTMPTIGAVIIASSAVKLTRAALGEFAGINLVCAHIHDESANNPHQHGCRQRHEGHGRQAFHDVIQQPLHPAPQKPRASRSSA